MKKAILLTMSMMLVSLFALANHTEAVFVSKSGDTFMLVMNGQRITPRPVARIRLDDLPAGNHRIKIKLFRGSYAETITKNIVLRPGTISKFAIKTNRRNGFGVIRKVREEHINRGWQFNDRSWYGSGDVYWDDDDAWHRPGQGNRSRGGRGNGYHGPIAGNPGHRGFQCQHAFHFNIQQVIRRMNRQYFEEDKFRLARRATQGQPLLTEDVVAIMQQFSFEESRIDFAIYAYPMVCDKQNFELVKSALRFRASHRRVNNQLHCWN